MYFLCKGIQNKDYEGVNTTYFVPLISNNRVLGYNQNDTTILKDNIAYKSTNLPSSNNLIQSTELRPAISLVQY
jgi:hypothetical protein